MIRQLHPHELEPKHIEALMVLGDEWWTADELWRDLLRGHRALLEVPGGLCMMRVCGQALFVDALVGKGIREWIDELGAFLMAEARRLGLSEVAARCRLGFTPFAREHGWHETHREFRRKVA